MTYDFTGDWKRSCQGKRRYTTRDEARTQAKLARRSGGRLQYAYQCEYCGYYHTGHRKAPKKPKKG